MTADFTKKKFYHGTRNMFEKPPVPSPEKPFFVADRRTYAARYCDGHTIQESEGGYVYTVTFSRNPKIFDLQNARHIGMLSCRDFLKDCFSFFSIPIFAVNLTCLLVKAVAKKLGDPYGVDRTNIGGVVAAKDARLVEFMKRVGYTDGEISKAYRPGGGIGGLMIQAVDEFRNREITKAEIDSIAEDPFDNRKALYHMFARLALDEVLDLGYDAVTSIEQMTGDRRKSLCIGLIRPDSLGMISMKATPVMQSK